MEASLAAASNDIYCLSFATGYFAALIKSHARASRRVGLDRVGGNEAPTTD